MRTSLILSRCLKLLGVLGLIALAIGLNPSITLAQLDNANKPFQMEGDATTTATICFLSVANGGPAIATPVAPSTNGTDSNGCPTISPAGGSTTWSLVTYGASGGPSDDWDRVYCSAPGGLNGAKCTGANALAVAFTNDAVNTQTDNAFLGSSSKLANNINTWTWGPSKPQGKSDIENAMAAAYTLSNGDIGVYLGVTRFDNSGSITFGFVLAQDPKFDLCTGAGTGANGPDPNCTATNTFAGQSTVNDLLVLGVFTQGGAVSTIQVYHWNGTTWSLDKTVSPAPCDPTLGTSNIACGVTNDQFVQSLNSKGAPVLSMVNTASPWPFSNKGSQTSFALGEFMEIGIDLNSEFGANLPCFTRFMALSTSSPAAGLTDSLSDLTAPINFPLCGASITKSCTSAHVLSDGATIEYDYGGTITNTGIAGLTNVCVTDTPDASIGATNNTVNQPSVCTTGTLAGGGVTASYTGSFDTTTLLSQQQNKATVNATAVDGTAISPASAFWLNGAGATLCSPPETPGLSITKKCTGTSISSSLAITVSYSGTVTNTGNLNITGLSVTDTPDGQLATSVACKDTGGNTVTVLAPGASCSYGGSYTATKCEPADAGPPSSTADNGRCLFTDSANASGTAALGGGTVNALPASGQCSLCPFGSCSTTTP